MPPETDSASPSPARFAFPKARRLRRRGDFVRLSSSRARVHTPHFLLLLGVGPTPTSPSRLGVTVTRKVGTAVARNRVKRLVREAFRLAPTLLPIGVDLVVIAKDGAPTLALSDVQREWSAVLPLLQRRAREVAKSATEKARSAREKQPPGSQGSPGFET